MKQLAILIPTLPVRVNKYARLVSELNKQIIQNGLENKIQIVSLCDTKDYLVGHKRNMLVNISLAKYICFIDDDDDISHHYIKKIYDATLLNRDCVTFLGEYRSEVGSRSINMSIKNTNDIDTDDCYIRLPNHLSVVKRNIALKCPFPLKNFGEDYEYALLLKKHLKTEVHIEEKLYFYNYNSSTSQTNSTNKSNQFHENN